jgi:hypothetical protein
MEVIITEKCPVPIVDMNEVPSKVFLKLHAAYCDWVEAATQREVERLKATGELPDGFIWWFATPKIAE